jgi:23S rRNA pseudouridine955/2504/2580 synthase
MSVQFKTVDEFSTGQRLDNYLLKILKGVPKSHIYRVIRKGEVRVNKGRKKADYKLQVDDVVRIPPIRVAESKPSKTSDSLKKLLTESILYEDKGLLVINTKILSNGTFLATSRKSPALLKVIMPENEI